MLFPSHLPPQKLAIRIGLTAVLPVLCSGCLLFGNPCGSTRYTDQHLDKNIDVAPYQMALVQDDGTLLIPEIDCVEACEAFADGHNGLELLDLDFCELSLHPGLEDPSQLGERFDPEEWKRVEAIEAPILLPADTNQDQTIIFARCKGLYRAECQNT